MPGWKLQSFSTAAKITPCSWNCSPIMARGLSLNIRAFAFAFAFLLACAAGAVWAQPQQARRAQPPGWSLCNETSYVLEAATGRPDGRAILVSGWVRLRPGECRLAVAAPLARGMYYLYALR